MEAEAKDGIYDDIVSLTQLPSLCHLLCRKERDIQGFQLLDQTVVQRLVCPLWICHLHSKGASAVPHSEHMCSKASVMYSCALE